MSISPDCGLPLSCYSELPMTIRCQHQSPHPHKMLKGSNKLSKHTSQEKTFRPLQIILFRYIILEIDAQIFH